MPGQSSRSNKPVALHIIHDLGGGGHRWLTDFIAADDKWTNLVLCPFTYSHASSEGLALFDGTSWDNPLDLWCFEESITGSVVTHIEYRRILHTILERYRIEAILISSLIGHALDALTTSAPTLIVNHDYFPYCPAIYICFDGLCEQCDNERLALCAAQNEKFDAFPGYSVQQRIAVRDFFIATITSKKLPLVVPSASVVRNLNRLEPKLGTDQFTIIPHGNMTRLPQVEYSDRTILNRLVILVLGRLSHAKGLDLLTQTLTQITEFADVYLVGAGEMAICFDALPHVHIVSEYLPQELPGHVAAIQPDLGLLLSIVPETFSYTLTELFEMGIPPAATRLGGFEDRIVNGDNGLLFEPNPDSLLDLLSQVNRQRSVLQHIRARLRTEPFRSALEMVTDYQKILPMENASKNFNRVKENSPATRLELLLADMWKKNKSLHVSLTANSEAMKRLERHAGVLQLESDKQFRTIEYLRNKVLDQAEQLQQKDQMLEQIKASTDAALKVKDDELRLRDGLLRERDECLLAKDAAFVQQGAHLSALLSSTSWRVTAPMRWIVLRARNAQRVARGVRRLLAQQGGIVATTEKIVRIWKSSGWMGLKRTLAAVENSQRQTGLWEDYQQRFLKEVRPTLVKQERSMHNQPLISVIVPTYNTPVTMFSEMLESVTAQIYRNWELCIVDDGSTDADFVELLERVEQRDKRIRVYRCKRNGGVARASNYALGKVSGSYVVLLDHDDCFEEQALLRVAETIITDNPDMFYSDEALFSEDMSTLKTLALRPKFSPEYLRGHPYFVHLVGFRTSLLHKIGGFDEALRISQDYDLFLRATERAQKIVHIPEVLYRWRIHNTSAGHQMMDRVMATSKSILQRHLDRSGEAGSMDDGPSFNFFGARYTVSKEHRVAIIIPTKNHGQLVRQCIESIFRTVHKTTFDILLIDHDSNDPDSLAYFATLADTIKILRYRGPFNFSAINNWAVSQVGHTYTHYLFCNNDIEAIEEGWLERMLELGQKPTIGIVGARLSYPDRITIQHAGVCIGAFGRAEHYGKQMVIPNPNYPTEIGYNGQLLVNREVSAVTAACLLMKAEAFDEIHGFDEQLAVGFGDVDLCLRAGEKGWRILYCAMAHLVHHESLTRGINNLHPEDTALFLTRWKEFIEAGDPYYNPNLSLTSTRWDFANPLPTNVKLSTRVHQKKSHLSDTEFPHPV